jgi:integrase
LGPSLPPVRSAEGDNEGLVGDRRRHLGSAIGNDVLAVAHPQRVSPLCPFEGFDEPKTEAGRRTVAIPPFLIEVLEQQLAERAQPGKDGLVFVNTRGKTPHLSSFTSQTWKKARERIGRPDLRWHDLRHTWVAMKIEAGAHPKEIQEEAGHSSYNTTMNIYGHLFESRGEKTADAMDAMYQAALAAPKTATVVRIGESA